MTTLFEQMQQYRLLAQQNGNEVKRWQIRTDLFSAVETAALEAGELSQDGPTILGAPYSVGDRVASANGMLLIELGPR